MERFRSCGSGARRCREGSFRGDEDRTARHDPPGRSPRISPVEPYFTSEQLLFGVMARSHKARDLSRDSRCVLHSSVVDPNAGESEFKLYGTAVDPELAEAPADAWWLSHPPDAARVFALRIDQASSVVWALARGELTVTIWSASGGLRQETRSYP